MSKGWAKFEENVEGHARKSLSTLNRLLRETWMLKILLMRSQKQVWNALLETRTGGLDPCYVLAGSVSYSSVES